MGRSKRIISGRYKCGCLFGPAWVQEVPTRCPKHATKAIDKTSLVESSNGQTSFAGSMDGLSSVIVDDVSGDLQTVVATSPKKPTTQYRQIDPEDRNLYFRLWWCGDSKTEKESPLSDRIAKGIRYYSEMGMCFNLARVSLGETIPDGSMIDKINVRSDSSVMPNYILFGTIDESAVKEAVEVAS